MKPGVVRGEDRAETSESGARETRVARLGGSAASCWLTDSTPVDFAPDAPGSTTRKQ